MIAGTSTGGYVSFQPQSIFHWPLSLSNSSLPGASPIGRLSFNVEVRAHKGCEHSYNLSLKRELHGFGDSILLFVPKKQYPLLY